MNNLFNLIIIGSGPAGYTAAIYAARANLKPLLFEGPLSGGQLTTTTEIENFPGFPEGIMGSELMDLMRQQAARFGTEMIAGAIEAVDFSKRPFKLTADGKDYFAQAVIIATGASARYLGLASERRLIGKGVSACATCDGAFFRNQKIAVVGGGDTALEEAIFLTRFASSVTLIHRRDALRASKIMQERVLNHPKIQVLWNTVITECLGDTQLTGLKLKNVKDGAEREEKFDGLFVAVGHTPATQIFKDQLDLDEQGYIITQAKSTRTNVDGVFACGDVQEKIYPQAITAAGSGAIAAIEVERWLETVGRST